jgi:hypothetical protein
MELDLSRYRLLLVLLAAILLLSSIGWLGHAYLPSGDKLLSRTEWQVLKADLAYRKELSRLQDAAGDLAALLNDRPDPVRAQLTHESIQRLTRQGQPALGYSREKLAAAAQAISDWAVGAIEREVASQVLEEALQLLHPTQPPFSTSSPKGNRTLETERR